MTDRPDAAKVREMAALLSTSLLTVEPLLFLADALEGKGDWQVVPKVPTQAMLDDVTSSEQRYPVYRADDVTMSDIYQAMLAAAKERDNG